MGLRRKSGKAPQDETTKSLLNHGVYRVEMQDHEQGHFHHKVPFSFWSGVKYTFVLSVLLWWMPTVGQMIAGYVGGRRTGSPWKGVFAAIVPLVIIFGVAYAMDHGYLGLRSDYFWTLPSMVVHSVSGTVPALAPYVDFAVQYFSQFIVAMRSTFFLGSNGYMVTVVFAYVGGIMAEQARREVAATGRSGTNVSITQPIIHHSKEDNEMVGFRRKEPVELAAMKKIPASQVASAHRAPEFKPEEEQKAKPAPVSAKSGSSKHDKKLQEPVQMRSEKDEVRMQHFVEQALSRYETKRH